jgi:hypothetical protein
VLRHKEGIYGAKYELKEGAKLATIFGIRPELKQNSRKRWGSPTVAQSRRMKVKCYFS